MTEPSTDVADRLARLRERRGQPVAASPSTPAAPSAPGNSTARRRRVSPAGGAKIVVAGASATAVLGLVAAYGWNDRPAAVEAAAPAVTPVVAPLPPGAAPTTAPSSTAHKVVIVVVEATADSTSPSTAIDIAGSSPATGTPAAASTPAPPAQATPPPAAAPMPAQAQVQLAVPDVSRPAAPTPQASSGGS